MRIVLNSLVIVLLPAFSSTCTFLLIDCFLSLTVHTCKTVSADLVSISPVSRTYSLNLQHSKSLLLLWAG